MGSSSSKQQKKLDSSINYANGSKAPEVGKDELAPQVMEEVAAVHTEPINSLYALQDDQLLSGGVDKDVVLYCWTQHKTRARFKGPAKDVTKVNYNSKSGLICAASRDRVIYGWKWPREENETDASTPQPVTEVFSEPDQTFNGHTLGVTALAMNDEYSQLLVSGSRDNSVGLWDIVTSKSISSMYAPRNLVTGLEWIGGEKAVLQSSEDKTLRVWDLRTCSTVQQFRARNYLQTCCAVSESRQQFLSGSSGTGSAGAEVNLWDRRNEKRPIREFKGHTENVLDCMFLSYKEQQLVVSVSRDSTVRIWERDSGDALLSEYLGVGPLTSLVSPSPGIIGSSSFNGGVILWTLMADLASDSKKSWTLSLRAKY